MAIMLGGAAFHAAQKLKARLLAIGAHVIGISAGQAAYSAGDVYDALTPEKRLKWLDLVQIAHRKAELAQYYVDHPQLLRWWVVR